MSANKQNLITKLLEIVDMQGLMEKTIVSVAGTYENNEFVQKGTETVKNLIDFPEIIQEISKVYDNVYTEQELTDIVDFYSSKTGKRVIQLTPTITAACHKVVVSYMDKISDKITEGLDQLEQEMQNEQAAEIRD